MSVDEVFRMANAIALMCWLGLVAMPRKRWLWLIGQWAIALLCAGYATLVAVYLFPSGGDFPSLDGVRRLFGSPPVLLAGWVHYLAFDLFVGGWMARRMDAFGLSRWLQAPLLLVTFMLGPVGLLVGANVLIVLAWQERLRHTGRIPELAYAAAASRRRQE